MWSRERVREELLERRQRNWYRSSDEIPVDTQLLRTMRSALIYCLLTVLVIPSLAFPSSCVAGDPNSFSSELEALRAELHVPAIAAAAMYGNELVEIAATGLRRADGTEQVTIEDQWHVGSCTKSMTATLAAILVEKGVIKWQTTLEEVFPEARATMHPSWHSVTLDQLLSHRAGAPVNPPEDLWHEAEAWKHLNPAEQRRAFSKMLLERPPEYRPGWAFGYSDDGYAIAGAMLERRARKPWEEMIRNELFEPLGMKSAGFGAPGHPNSTDQPWGHCGTTDALVPMPPGLNADFPAAIAPGATVHCSIGDLARYAAWHARAGRPPGPYLLTPESFYMLHAPARYDYALGWGVMSQPWTEGKVLIHTGTNMYWYAEMWVVPQRDAAFVAATNCHSPEATGRAIKLLVERVLGVHP